MIYNPQQAFFFFVEGSDEEEEYEAIDLGLPSGTLWANKNVGATSETNKDLYFQWGSVEGYSFSDAKIAIKDLPGMSGVTTWNTTYTQDSTSNKLITLWDNTYLGVNELNQDEGNNVLKRQVDAAAYNMGGEWRMPYPSELLELIQYTTATTYKDCMKLTSTVKGYTDKYVLFPIDNVKDDSSSSISYFRGEIWSNVTDIFITKVVKTTSSTGLVINPGEIGSVT